MEPALGIFLIGAVGSALPAAEYRFDAIPPGEAEAKAALDRSPRHHEWVDIALPGSSRKIAAFVAYPERRDKAPVVVVIHEIYGLTDWIRAVADQLAADGFLAVAPDFLSGRGPGGGGTGAFASRDDVVKAVHGLSDADVAGIVDAAAAYGTGLPAAKNRFGAIGFCWGGSQSFAYAAHRPDLGAAVVYYGTDPGPEGLKKIKAPVLGLYGEDDARVTTTVGPAEAAMKQSGKSFTARIYKGAGHGFLRAQNDRAGANLAASREAWPETVRLFKNALDR